MDDRFIELIGNPLKEYLKAKYGSLSRAARQFEIDPTFLSKILKGTRKPNQLLVLKFVKDGFDKEHFDKYYMLDKINVEQLTKKEILELVSQQSLLIQQQRELITNLSDRLTRYIDANLKLTKLIQDKT